MVGILLSTSLAAGADPKVVQRVLGHATAAMTMDLYGHLVDGNLWQAARLVGDISGTFEPTGTSDQSADESEADGNAWREWVFGWSDPGAYDGRISTSSVVKGRSRSPKGPAHARASFRDRNVFLLPEDD
jgi:hypothetical protein